MEWVLTGLLYLLLGIAMIYLYDLMAFRKLRIRAHSHGFRMTVEDWDKVYDCTYLMKIDSQALAVILSIVALILWPVTLSIMEVKRHIANHILKKYRRDE